MTTTEHKLNVIRQIDELTEESLVEVEKLIETLRTSQQAEQQERKIHLTTEDMQLFFQALENPPKANTALKDAANWHKRWIKNA